MYPFSAFAVSGGMFASRECVRGIDKKIVLIDGAELVELMVEHNIGVSQEATISLKHLDNDYFEEE